MRLSTVIIFLYCLISLHHPVNIFSQNSDIINSPINLSSNDFENTNIILLKKWKLFSSDIPPFPGDSVDSESTLITDSTLPPTLALDSKWPGIVWFQTSVFIDSSLADKKLGFYFSQRGASEIYLNKKLIYSIGTIFPTATNEFTANDSYPRIINFIPGEINTISIRYSNHRLAELWQKDIWGGFSMRLGLIDEMISFTSSQVRTQTIKEVAFIVIPLTLVIIHLFLFLFDRKFKQNFYFTLFLTAFIVFIYSNYQIYFSHNIFTVLSLREINNISLLLTVFFASASIRSIFSKLGKLDLLNFIIAVGLSVAGVYFGNLSLTLAYYIFISYLFSLASNSIYSRKAQKGISILRIGFALMSLSGIYQMLHNAEVFPPIFGESGIFIYGVISFIISMSVYLAYEFIRTGKELEQKIGEVRTLSKANYEKEISAQKKEIEKKILEADNQRKTRELEDARKLQLSMLPKKIVNTEYFDIAVKMETAAEVGGDYYDSIQNSSGLLNIALGDATGHGNKAGIMVAIIKSLFISSGSSLLIPDFFKKCTAVIRKMKLGNLYMSLILMRTNGREVILSSAGMPPVLHYVKSKNAIKEIVTKSMPLGAVKDFPYETTEFSLEKDDVLLLFSDGIIELRNEKKEFFGLTRLINEFGITINEGPDEIIKNIFIAGNKWRNSAPVLDDITIMAIKVK